LLPARVAGPHRRAVTNGRAGKGAFPVHPSRFNARVQLPGQEVFLMNTFTDAQAIVSEDVAGLLDRLGQAPLTPEDLGSGDLDVLEALEAEGFVVRSREEERLALEAYFREFREDASELRVTVLTTLQCNFACGYCIQGDHGDYNKHVSRMSLDTAERVAGWVEDRLDALAPERLVLTFFGGEPLLNLRALYVLADRLADATRKRGVALLVNIITNGLLLTREVVDRLAPYGLAVKVTLDGAKEAHDRYRPLRGGQGTFDRIVANLRAVAGRCRLTIGGNFDADSLGSYRELLTFLRQQEFAPSIAKVTFKPIIRQGPAAPKGVIPLTSVGDRGAPLNGACMTSAGAGVGSPCDTCHFVDEHMSFLREETTRHGFDTVDGVHMGPCELYRRHAHTVGPDGALYACPGFSGESDQSVGHIDGGEAPAREAAATAFERLAPWRQCGDCSFIPVCGGGCAVAAHTELGDMHAPACHKSSFESALVSLAMNTAGTQERTAS
jgi:uncharacterized protein